MCPGPAQASKKPLRFLLGCGLQERVSHPLFCKKRRKCVERHSHSKNCHIKLKVVLYTWGNCTPPGTRRNYILLPAGLNIICQCHGQDMGILSKMKFVVPLRIPAKETILFAESEENIVLITGIPPHTAASNIKAALFSRATAKSS